MSATGKPCPKNPFQAPRANLHKQLDTLGALGAASVNEDDTSVDSGTE